MKVNEITPSPSPHEKVKVKVNETTPFRSPHAKQGRAAIKVNRCPQKLSYIIEEFMSEALEDSQVFSCLFCQNWDWSLKHRFCVLHEFIDVVLLTKIGGGQDREKPGCCAKARSCNRQLTQNAKVRNCLKIKRLLHKQVGV